MSTSNSSNGKQLRAAGYCRTSGEGQRDNTSIPRQKEAVEAFCKANGWRMVRHYVDECKSGASTEGRTSFQELLRDAANGRVDVVVPFDATRFARDGVDVVSTAKVLKASFGVYTVDAKGQFDNRDHRNALRNFVQAGVSEHERLTIMERMVGGRIQKARDGQPWCSNLPFGRAFAGGKWGVNEAGHLLAALLARYADGEPMAALCREYGWRAESAVVRHVHEDQLAANPYVATFHSPEIGVVNLRVPVPAVPPVISPTLERRVIDRLAHNRTWNKAALRKYLLSGFVRCGHCGAALTSETKTKGGAAYFKHNRGVGTGGRECPFRSVRSEAVEGPVLDFLYRWFVDQPAFDLAVKLALPDPAERKAKEAEVVAVAHDLERAERAVGRLVDAVAAGADPALLVSKQSELKDRADGLRKRLVGLQDEVAALPDPKAVQEEAEVLWAMLAQEHIEKDWRRQPYEDVRRFLHFLFGDNPGKEKLGVYLRRSPGGWAADVRARLRLRSPWTYTFGSEAKHTGDMGFGRPTGAPAGDGQVYVCPVNTGVDLITATGRGHAP